MSVAQPPNSKKGFCGRRWLINIIGRINIIKVCKMNIVSEKDDNFFLRVGVSIAAAFPKGPQVDFLSHFFKL